jgi:molybdenum cofactor cytidylyltransferase
MVAAIVLAAGMSSRYGANKLLLPFAGGTVISRAVSCVTRSLAQPVVVVTGHQADQIQAALQPWHDAITFVHNADYDTGEMLSSIKAGLYYLLSLPDPAPQAALIVLGDQPLIRLDVLQRLCEAFERNCGDLIAPRLGVDGPRGHPVLIGRHWWDTILALPADGNVRDLLRANHSSMTHLVVNSDSILGDVDTPDAYHAALAHQNES